MLFNSLEFLIFFPLVMVAYFALPHRLRWVLLLAASYYFYMRWRWNYAILMAGSTVIGWACSCLMESRAAAARPWLRPLALATGVGVNLLVLFVFKYFNFARELLLTAAPAWATQIPAIHVLLPVGISFYTFQVLSYCVDVYRREITVERHFGQFALYIAFFPQLVAGPIERAAHILPQLKKAVHFSYPEAVEGLKLMAWGFFKKLAVADRLAPYVEIVYGRPHGYDGGTFLMATYLFAFQIYADFSAYSDIARGAARILGIRLMLNFNSPYSAQSIREFWQRWHISLSTWFRDYVYVALGGNRVTAWRNRLNLLVVFVVSGIWHGANLTFVVWGALHGFYLLVENLVWGKRRSSARAGGLAGALRVLVVFHLVVLGWVFFRAANLSDAWVILGKIVGGFDLRNPQLGVAGYPTQDVAIGLLLAGLMLAVDHAMSRRDLLGAVVRLPRLLRWSLYIALLLGLYFGGVFNSTSFIYFQF